MEELASLTSRVFESTYRRVGEIFAALLQHNLTSRRWPWMLWNPWLLKPTMALLSHGNDLALETPVITSASLEDYGEEDSSPELSESPGSLFSCEYCQTQLLKKIEEKLLSLRDRDESSTTRWLIHGCNFLTLTCLKGQLMEMDARKHSYKVVFAVRRYFPNHKTYSSTEKRLRKNMRGLLSGVLELYKRDTVCTNPLTHYKTGRNRSVWCPRASWHCNLSKIVFCASQCLYIS